MGPSRPPRHPLRDILPTPDPGLRWLTGIVTQVDTARTPHTIRVRLADGTITEPITFLGWWAPLVNDTAEVIAQGSKLMALGAVAPANPAARPATPIVQPAPPAAPPAPPVVRTVNVEPVDMAYWSVRYGWRTDGLVQGGPDNRTHWWYGDAISLAREGGVIIGGSVFVERSTFPHGAPVANVRLGVHTQQSRPAVGNNPLAEVAVSRTLTSGQASLVPLTAAQIARLNTDAHGLGLEPGATAGGSPDHLRVTIGGASGALSLTVQV
jgi:hypothetical protein